MPVLRRRTSSPRLSAATIGPMLAALAFGVVSVMGSTASADEVMLKAAVFVPTSTTYGVQFKRFVDRVNETGKGVLQIRIVGGPEAVPADGQAQAVKSGVLDIASIPPTYYKSQMVEGDAQTLSDLSVAEQRKSGDYALLNQIAGEHLGALYLTTYGMGVPFHLYVTKDMAITKRTTSRVSVFAASPSTTRCSSTTASPA